MKKALIAVAVTGAFAGSAVAQNVTVYGLIDATVAQIKTGSTSVTAQGQGDYLGSSMIGFRGTEDLGGGLKASFQLEGDLNVNNGAGDGGSTGVSTTATTNANGGLTFDRQSWVGISGAFGSVRVGRMSDFADSTYGFGQAGANLFDNDSSLGSKNPNNVEYATKFMGHDLVINYSNDTGAVAAGTGQGTSSAVVGIAGSAQGISYRVGVVEQGSSTETVAAAKTTFGAAEVGVMLNQQDRGTYKTSNSSVGVVYGIGNGVNVRANYMNFNNNTTATSKFTFAGVMVDKSFSKRTSIFAGYGKKDVNNGTTSDVTTTTIGVQHSF